MENPNPYTRSGNLTIGGQQFLVMQAGAPGTAPRVEFMSRTESGVTVFMEGEPWKAYILEYSEDLTHWIPLSTNGVTSIITDRTAGNAPRRFYRTVEIP
jgi:hypothetical protein